MVNEPYFEDMKVGDEIQDARIAEIREDSIVLDDLVTQRQVTREIQDPPRAEEEEGDGLEGFDLLP